MPVPFSVVSSAPFTSQRARLMSSGDVPEVEDPATTIRPSAPSAIARPKSSTLPTPVDVLPPEPKSGSSTPEGEACAPSTVARTQASRAAAARPGRSSGRIMCSSLGGLAWCASPEPAAPEGSSASFRRPSRRNHRLLDDAVLDRAEPRAPDAHHVARAKPGLRVHPEPDAARRPGSFPRGCTWRVSSASSSLDRRRTALRRPCVRSRSASAAPTGWPRLRGRAGRVRPRR